MHSSPDSIVLTLPDSTDSPRIARRGAEQWLRSTGTAVSVIEAVVLVVSELVTNAVEHTGSEPQLEVTRRGDTIRVSVHDAERTGPVVRPGGGSGGFGLRIVSRIASAWGWEPTSQGKVVWAEFTA
jgi:anti-sigma regulatory factor (Ser/Thr protein kinase)